MYYPLIRKALFQLDAEKAHSLVLRQLRYLPKTPLACLLRQSLPEKPVTCMGLRFKNPVGLAAGLDKNGECIEAFELLGFGAVEVGTVTPKAQAGNDKPRLFRLTQAQGLINRMGFNNAGVDNLLENISQACFSGVLGVNIGKNKNTPVEQSKDDYLCCMDKLYPYAGYIAVNISSPNTPGLRTLQYGEALDDLLNAVKEKQQQLQQKYNKYVPLAVKIAPDLTHAELVQVADSLLRHHIDGVIATNTTLDKSTVQGQPNSQQSGGLSGSPLRSKSDQVIRLLAAELQGRLPIIGVGGVDSVAAAKEKLASGASLLQLYSAFIYQGPALIRQIVMAI